MLARPLPFGNRRSILSNCLQIPLWAFGCHPGSPALFLGQLLGSPETLRQGRLAGGLVPVCVFYLLLTDHMFQERFPVIKTALS